MKRAIEKQEAARIPSPVGRDYVILVVDDEEDIRRMVALTLENAGYVVLEARHGAEAMERVSDTQGPIDLIVIDLMMPFVDGATLAHVVQAQRPEIQVLFITGYPHDALQRWEVLDASTPRLQKPFHLRDLVRIVAGLLRG